MSDCVYDKKMTWAKKKIAKNTFSLNEAMREKRHNTEVFLVSIFLYSDLINGDLQSESPYSVRIQENTFQKISVFGHFSRSEDKKR